MDFLSFFFFFFFFFFFITGSFGKLRLCITKVDLHWYK
jgi:hypothetical protein